MLSSLYLKNVKSWHDSGEIRLAPITGLFGSNSSGKTSILQALLLLKQTVESTDRAQVLNFGDERTLVDLGTFREFVYGHDAQSTMAWSFDWELPKPIALQNPEGSDILFEPSRLHFHASVKEFSTVSTLGAGARLAVECFEYQFLSGNDEHLVKFGMERGTGSSQSYRLTADGYELKRPPGRPLTVPTPIRFYGFPEQVFAYYQNVSFLADLQLALEQVFTRTFYLGPLREHPRRQYTWAGGQPSDMGRRGERTIDALLASRARGELIPRGRGRHRRSLEWVVAFWLQELGLIQSFQVRPIAEGSNLYQVYVKKTAHSPEVFITDVGFGVSQILPVLTLLFYVSEGSTVILEQPEMHLHPSVQAGLADVLIDAVQTRKIQIVLESHSEHLLRRLQRRIAEAQLDASMVALYFCQAGDAGSQLTPLDVDAYGNITNWPQDFFGDELGELAEMATAGIKRRLAESST